MQTKIENSGAMVGSITSMRYRKCFPIAAAWLLLGAAGASDADNLTVTAQNLWNSDVLYTAEVNTISTTGCDKQIVGAAPEIVVKGVTYGFLFWDINAAPYTDKKVNFQPVCGSGNTAIAVYWPICTGTCPGVPTADGFVAYSLNEHKVIPGVTPIASASSGWTPGSTSVVPPATVDAVSEIVPYGKFKGWYLPPDPISTSNSLPLPAAPGATVFAFFGIPEPDPCQSIRNSLDNAEVSCSGDLGSTACQTLIHGLNVELNACEVSYGEIAPPKP